MIKKKYFLVILLVIVLSAEFYLLGQFGVFNFSKLLNIRHNLKPVAAGSFSMVVLPDTQHYSAQYPDIFCDQTNWILANQVKLNTVFVSQLGDIVNDGGNVAKEWQVALTCLGKLNGKIPYGLIPGNHDTDLSTPGSGYKTFNKVFPAENFKQYAWYQGNYHGNQNNYEIVAVGNQSFLFLNLEYDPAADVINWAQSAINLHPKAYTILTTHKYLPITGQTRDNTGERLWQNLVFKNCSIKLVWSGHYHGENRLASLNSCGQPVEQIVQDYQDREMGGNGFLRVYEFIPSEKIIKVYTYSPETGQLETDADSQFSLPFLSGN